MMRMFLVAEVPAAAVLVAGLALTSGLRGTITALVIAGAVYLILVLTRLEMRDRVEVNVARDVGCNIERELMFDPENIGPVRQPWRWVFESPYARREFDRLRTVYAERAQAH